MQRHPSVQNPYLSLGLGLIGASGFGVKGEEADPTTNNGETNGKGQGHDMEYGFVQVFTIQKGYVLQRPA